jgi:hypothetical protein
MANGPSVALRGFLRQAERDGDADFLREGGRAGSCRLTQPPNPTRTLQDAVEH